MIVDRATSPLIMAQIYYGYNWWSEDFPRTAMARGPGDGRGGRIVMVPGSTCHCVHAGNYSVRSARPWTSRPAGILPAVREAEMTRRAGG
jgi:hypothetical protein